MRVIIVIGALLTLIPTLVLADLDSDFAACRRKIIQIGSNAKVPADQYCLGLSHAFGLNHKKNQAEAARWDRKSAEQGNADGQFRLGRAYQFGIGVPQNRQEAIRWFDKAGD